MIHGHVSGGIIRLDESQSLPEGAEVRVELVRPGQPPSAIALLDKWLQDESGYDEETWPKLKSELDKHRLSARGPKRGQNYFLKTGKSF